MLLAWVERIGPLCFSGNGSFLYPFSAYIGNSCYACEGEAVKLVQTGARGGVLSRHLCEEPERASMTIKERCEVVDKVSNSAGHE